MPVKTWRDKGGVKVRHFDCGDVNLEAEMEVVEEWRVDVCALVGGEKGRWLGASGHAMEEMERVVLAVLGEEGDEGGER